MPTLLIQPYVENAIIHGLIPKKEKGNLAIDISMDEKYIMCVIEDNGIGFDETQAERIFQPFERLFGRSQYEGTGMGLAICRGIVQAHNGLITVKSQPGKGSCFTVTLPEKVVQK